MLDDIPMIAEATGSSPNETVVFGRSVGSIFALEWVRRFPQTRALVIESGIHDVFERLALRIAPNEMNLDDLETAIASRVNHGSVLSDFSGPSLFLHAEHDQLVSIAHAERNAAAAGGRAELVRLPHGGHNSVLWENATEYLSKLGAFLSL